MLQISYLLNNSFEIVEFDAVVTETHSISSIITTYAVEEGADIGDHKRPGPRKLQLEAVVSNTPLGAPLLSGFNNNAEDVVVTQRFDPSSKINTNDFSREFDRVSDMLNELTDLAELPIMLTITTDVRVYENVQITNVSAPRTVEDGDAIAFIIDAEQVRIAQTENVVVQTSPREPRGRRRNNNGAQATSEVDTNTTTGTIEFNARENESSTSLATQIGLI